jgi:hypothetical protein
MSAQQSIIFGKSPPLIICEARSTKGVLERIVREYLAPITATGG